MRLVALSDSVLSQVDAAFSLHSLAIETLRGPRREAWLECGPQDSALVKKSARLSLELTLLTQMVPSLIFSQMKWYLILMCFVCL